MKIHRPKTLGELRKQLEHLPDETPIGLTTLNLLMENVPQTLEIVESSEGLTIAAPSGDM